MFFTSARPRFVNDVFALVLFTYLVFPTIHTPYLSFASVFFLLTVILHNVLKALPTTSASGALR